jgi:hypothetical protein
VPDLGYKRGLGDNVVIAPYATGLAAMIDASAAALNFRRMEREGARGPYGWYEAMDYTPSRVPEGAKVGIVKAYMAHHQAMAIVGIANAITGGMMRRRFHAEPIIRATELLLQERMPRDIAVARPPGENVAAAERIEYLAPEIQRRYTSPHSLIPRTHILSNGTYAVMLTSAGSGYTRWRNIDITRWREDSTCDNWGSYIYLRDTRSGEVWSAGYQPTGDRTRFLRGRLLRKPRRVHAPGRFAEDHDGDRGVVRARHGCAAGLHHESRNADARDRADVLRRARPCVACRRCHSSGVRQAVRRDGLRRGRKRSSRHKAAQIG